MHQFDNWTSIVDGAWLPYYPEITITGIDLPGNAYIQSSTLGAGTVILASSYGATPIPYIFVNLGTTWNYYNISMED